jgi:hypothetical protein
MVLKGVANYDGFNGVKETVENGAGRKFSLEDLRRLAWLYEWDGEALPTPKSKKIAAVAALDNDDPFLASSPPPSPLSLMDITLTPARTLSRGTRAPTYTYTFNLSITHTPSLGGLHGSLGRWSSLASSRRDELTRRLHRWVDLCREEEAKHGDEGDVPSVRGRVRQVPMKVLEPLPGAMGASTGALGELMSSNTGREKVPVSLGAPPAGTASPARILFPSTPSSSSKPTSLLATPPQTPTKTSVHPPNSLAARRQAMADRIAAKSGGPSLSSPAPSSSLGAGFQPKSAVKRRDKGGRRIYSQEELSRRSTLSRAIGFAESIYM